MNGERHIDAGPWQNGARHFVVERNVPVQEKRVEFRGKKMELNL